MIEEAAEVGQPTKRKQPLAGAAAGRRPALRNWPKCFQPMILTRLALSFCAATSPNSAEPILLAPVVGGASAAHVGRTLRRERPLS